MVLSTSLLFEADFGRLGTRLGTGLLLAGSLVGLLLLLVFPIALYVDGTRILEGEFDWQPNVALYVLGGVLSLLVPFLHQIVGLLYLYQRHRHVGAP